MAEAEYEVNEKANDEFPAGPQVRINELFLKCKETELAIEKAKLDQQASPAKRPRSPRPKSTPPR